MDNLPNATLDAFRATLSEALECDMLMVLVDAGDPFDEFERKIAATQREINSRYFGENTLDDFNERKLMCVLTKIETISSAELAEKQAIVRNNGYPNPLSISVHQNIGLVELQEAMLQELFGQPVVIELFSSQTGRSVEGYLSDVYDAGMIIDKQRRENGDLLVKVWISQPSLARLVSNSEGRIEVK